MFNLEEEIGQCFLSELLYRRNGSRLATAGKMVVLMGGLGY